MLDAISERYLVAPLVLKNKNTPVFFKVQPGIRMLVMGVRGGGLRVSLEFGEGYYKLQVVMRGRGLPTGQGGYWGWFLQDANAILVNWGIKMQVVNRGCG